MAASILAAYEISDPKDLAGNPITRETDLEFTNAMIRYCTVVDFCTTPLMIYLALLLGSKFNSNQEFRSLSYPTQSRVNEGGALYGAEGYELSLFPRSHTSGLKE